MATLLRKIESKGWSTLFLQGETQREFGRPKVYEFYTNATAKGHLFTTSLSGVSIHLVVRDVA